MGKRVRWLSEDARGLCWRLSSERVAGSVCVQEVGGVQRKKSETLWAPY